MQWKILSLIGSVCHLQWECYVIDRSFPNLKAMSTHWLTEFCDHHWSRLSNVNASFTNARNITIQHRDAHSCHIQSLLSPSVHHFRSIIVWYTAHTHTQVCPEFDECICNARIFCGEKWFSKAVEDCKGAIAKIKEQQRAGDWVWGQQSKEKKSRLASCLEFIQKRTTTNPIIRQDDSCNVRALAKTFQTFTTSAAQLANPVLMLNICRQSMETKDIVSQEMCQLSETAKKYRLPSNDLA